MERVGTDANTVGRWRRRFAERRLDGLYDEPRSGAPRKIGDENIAEIIGHTLEETPPGDTHWSLRSMARASGYASSTIHRTWQNTHGPYGLRRAVMAWTAAPAGRSSTAGATTCLPR